MKYIKKMPMPICGVILGLAALGNLLQSYSEEVRYCLGAVAGVLLLLFVVRCIACPDKLKEDLSQPITASVSGTFSMAIMLLSGYVKPWIGPAARIIWYCAVLLHALLFLYFTFKFLFRLKLQQVFASWFIVYVGIAVASVTAPAFEATQLGSVLFWISLVCFGIMLILVTIRYLKEKVPAPAAPLICIYAAPASLLIAGYVQSVTPKNQNLLFGLWIVASVLYLFALFKMLGYIAKPFYPSWAAFTFPFVISGIASKQFMACSANMEMPRPWLKPIVLAETVIAAVLVVYTLIRFLVFLFSEPKKS